MKNAIVGIHIAFHVGVKQNRRFNYEVLFEHRRTFSGQRFL